MNRARRAFAEFIGTAGLLVAVVGSGIMGERLADGNAALALLANAIATGGALFVLIVTLHPVSGAHINPAVTLTAACRRELDPYQTLCYIGAQISGAVAGVVLAHAMFTLPLLQQSTHLRSTAGEIIGEFIATTGLLIVLRSARAEPIPLIGGLVGIYIGAAYWFTSSTSFANPAVTLARSATDTFSGIAPESVAPFIGAQVVSVLAALALGRALFGPISPR